MYFTDVKDVSPFTMFLSSFNLTFANDVKAARDVWDNYIMVGHEDELSFYQRIAKETTDHIINTNEPVLSYGEPLTYAQDIVTFSKGRDNPVTWLSMEDIMKMKIPRMEM